MSDLILSTRDGAELKPHGTARGMGKS